MHSADAYVRLSERPKPITIAVYIQRDRSRIRHEQQHLPELATRSARVLRILACSWRPAEPYAYAPRAHAGGSSLAISQCLVLIALFSSKLSVLETRGLGVRTPWGNAATNKQSAVSRSRCVRIRAYCRSRLSWSLSMACARLPGSGAIELSIVCGGRKG